MSQDIEALLKFDPLWEAEKLTGKSYKEDKGTSDLGMALMLVRNAEKKRAMLETRDTFFNQSLTGYMEVAKDLGFREGYAEAFKGNSKDEVYYLLWHPDGILLSFDTYGGDHLNGGNFLYNWVPNCVNDIHSWISSGGGHEIDGQLVWSGYHDAREALKHNLMGLWGHGKFLAPWKVCDHLFLGNYKTKRPEIREWVNFEKSLAETNLHYLSMLPAEAQALFLPAYEARLSKSTVVKEVKPVRCVHWK